MLVPNGIGFSIHQATSLAGVSQGFACTDSSFDNVEHPTIEYKASSR